MDVRDVEQLTLARAQPPLARLPLTLRTVPVTTRNGELSITCLMGSARFWGADGKRSVRNEASRPFDSPLPGFLGLAQTTREDDMLRSTQVSAA
jgi:hypothetical protein